MANTSPFGPPGSTPVGLHARPGTSAGRGGKGRLIAIVVAALAILVVAVVAVKTLTGSDASKGGASSPQAAVTSFIDAVHNEDPLKLVDLLAPEEASLLRDGVQSFLDIVSGKDTTSQAGKAYHDQGIGTVDLSDLIPGFSIDFSNIDLKTEKLGANFSKVSLNGLDATWKFKAKQFTNALDFSSLNKGKQPSFKDNSGSFTDADIEKLYGASSPIDAPFLVTKQESGRWYVSIELTSLETIRLQDKLADANWGDIGATKNFGGDSPSDAVDRMLRALARGNTSEIIESLPPKKYESLYRFAGSFKNFTTNATVKVDVADNTVIHDSRGTILPLDGSSLTISKEDPVYGDKDIFTLLFDKDCFSYTEQLYDAYYQQTTNTKGNKCWSDLSQLTKNLKNSTIDFTWLKNIPDIDGFWLNVTKVDGRWFVDPLQTLGAYTSVVASAAKS